MLNIFSYNAYQRDIMPLWAFAVVIMVLGVLLLSISFARAIRRLQENTKE